MTITAQVEGVGNLEFPDGTDPAVVQATVKRVLAQRGAQQPAPQRPPMQPPDPPGFLDNLLAKVPTGLVNNRAVTAAKSFAMGAADPVVGTVQLGANMLPDSTGIPQQVNQAIKAKNDELSGERGQGAGFDLMRFAGNVASPVNLAVASRLPMAATTGGRAAQGAAMGFAGGASAPVEDASNGYWAPKGLQTGIGTVAGAILAPVAGKVADFVTKRINAGKIDPAKVMAETDDMIRRAVEETGQRLDDLPKLQVDHLRAQVQEALANGKKLDPAALLRKADFDAEGIQPTLGQITRDPMQFARERNLRGVQGVGEPLSVLMDEGNRKVSAGIRQFGQGASEAPAAGEKIAAALRAVDEEKRAGVTALYKAARESTAKDLDVPLQGLAQDYAGVLDRFADKVPAGVVNQFKKLGVDPSNPSNQLKTFTIEDADKLLKVINDNWSNEPATRKALGELSAAVKNAVKGVDATGGPFAPAVKAASERFKMHEAVPALEAAINGAPGDNFVQKFVLRQGAPARDVKEMAALLRQSSPEAFEEARAQIGEHLARAAFGENVAGDKLFRPEMYAKALRQITKEKLGAFFTPDEIAQLHRLGRVGAYQNSIPSVAAVNTSNTGSAVANLLRRGAGGALDLLPGGKYVSALGNVAKTAVDNSTAVNNAIGAKVPAAAAGELSEAQRRLIAQILSGGAFGGGVAAAP